MSLTDACARIAPAWPLDQLIAVNPWWPLVDQPMPEVSARLAALGGVRCLMSVDHYRSQNISAVALAAAAEEQGVPLAEVQTCRDTAAPRHWQSLAAMHQQSEAFSWRDAIVDQISRCCAMYWQEADQLYRHWLAHTRDEKGLALLMGCPELRKLLKKLPDNAEAMLELAQTALGIREEDACSLGHGWLLEINGWASAAAYQHWQADLAGEERQCLQQLLAIRLAWEWLTLQLAGQELLASWQQQSIPLLIEAHRSHQRLAWVWQRAAELDYQHGLARELAQPAEPQQSTRLQAVFCIDVRSEPMRRALEAQHAGIETRGFAGFFGLPLGYRPAGGKYQRPQLPGLLAPQIWVREAQPAKPGPIKLKRKTYWQRLMAASPGTFGAVEATGLAYAARLVKRSFWPSAPQQPVNRLLRESRGEFVLEDASGPLSVERQAELLAGVLNAMGLTEPAPLVLLVGHGSSTCNNPHAAGLDCGACGGQSGELNVRVLAQLANDPAVREKLARTHGIFLPPGSRFVAALHDTTADNIHCFDEVDAEVKEWLSRAGEQARAERAPRFGEASGKSLERRGWDWSQTRPEWGLAGNAAFVIAPRALTRNANLGGRVFLHDYDWEADSGYRQLETLLTAPMLVTHWINMQYNASVTDPQRYGSGNKILHNLVDNLGVLEGQGGDLRIGLSLQAVNDGKNWQHRPQRLCVVVAAPAEPLRALVSKHGVVRQLVDNHWLTLLRLDEDGNLFRLYRGEFRQEVL
ncbi:hypothetical protein AUP74_03038 [Microbulbifer aggregans]|uniref:Probable inorganic carbon transporter subunit DabA n=1 Tax=Microbulbifer aggregans TaxID=1769779 RepID=A0A1C9WB81_9GAMM|nr:DUF2309 domain-containing protein [Microbulbifer aggregans]AOS98404.1 hypothetical protein AUP74_03038 [Microbulbifer aggregans]